MTESRFPPAAHRLTFLIRTLTPVALIVLLACAAEGPRGESAPAAPTADQVARALDAWVGMWNSYDLAQVDRLFMHGPQVSYFSSEREGLISGFDELVAHHEGFGFVAGGQERPSRLWLEEVDITMYGGVAVVAAIWYFDRDGTDAEPQKGPVTFVYAPAADGPRIVHANFSEYLAPE
jgi:hypothetical protein